MERLLRRSEVADQLGVSVRTVQRLEVAGQIEPLRIGRAVRFRPEEVERFVGGK